MITAVCEMQDQDVGIQSVRLIENTTESIEEFEDEMSEHMGLFGHVFHYFDSEIPDSETDDEMKIYQWMRDNENKQIEI